MESQHRLHRRHWSAPAVATVDDLAGACRASPTPTRRGHHVGGATAATALDKVLSNQVLPTDLHLEVLQIPSMVSKQVLVCRSRSG